MEKRNTAVDLTDLAIGILILGIVVVVGSRILLLYRDSRLTSAPVVTTVNETLTAMSPTHSTALANLNVEGVTACVAQNGTGILGAGNYTQTVTGANSDTTTLTFSGSAGGDSPLYNNTNWNCTYTWYNTTGADDYTLANEAMVGLGEYGNWFDIIVIVGVAGVILALLFMAFRKKGEGASVAY